MGVSLAEFAGVKPYRGVLTGLNEAFLIDTPTKERLVREDPRCAEIIKPYLTPASLRALQSGYSEQLAPIQQRRTEAATLERRLSELVNAAYGLTPEEVALLWETAPPRMPLRF